MKTKDFDSFSQLNIRAPRRPRRTAEGPNIGSALLGIACVVGVFGLLALLYHFG